MSVERERREFIRLRTKLMTFVKEPKTGRVQRVLTKDIGGIGVCLVTQDVMEPGMTLEVELRLPDFDAPVTFTGAVVWSQRITEPGTGKPLIETGVTFVQIDPKPRAIIMQYAALNAVPPGA